MSTNHPLISSYVIASVALCVGEKRAHEGFAVTREFNGKNKADVWNALLFAGGVSKMPYFSIPLGGGR